MYRIRRVIDLPGCVCWADNPNPSFVQQWSLRSFDPQSHQVIHIRPFRVFFSASSSHLYCSQRRDPRLTLACIGRQTMHRSLVLDVFVLFFENPKDIWILPIVLRLSISQSLSMIERFIVSSVCKQPKSARLSLTSSVISRNRALSTVLNARSSWIT